MFIIHVRCFNKQRSGLFFLVTIDNLYKTNVNISIVQTSENGRKKKDNLVQDDINIFIPYKFCESKE